MRQIILYFFRAGVAFYFLYPSFRDFTEGVRTLKGNDFFSCLNDSYPTLLTFGVWHGLFIFLGLLILFWKHPLFPLLTAIIILILELTFKTISFTLLMQIVPVLCVAIGLAIYYSRHGEW
jgi:hypothetical protein